MNQFTINNQGEGLTPAELLLAERTLSDISVDLGLYGDKITEAQWSEGLKSINAFAVTIIKQRKERP